MAEKDGTEKGGGGVIQFDASLVKKLQHDLVTARQQRSEVIENSRLYWQRVQAVHESILLLLETKDLNGAATLLQDDVARLLGFDTAQFFYERLQEDSIGRHSGHFRAIPAFLVNAAFAATEYHLLHDRAQIETLFPEQAAMLAYAICLPIKTGNRRGALMLASREGQTPGAAPQALEPYVFLARCIERLGEKWLA